MLFFCLVWPEPGSSAAGVRIDRLVCVFNEMGWSVHISSLAEPSDYSTVYEYAQHYKLDPNSPQTPKSIQAINPDIVIFDRFMMEEQFGWQVAEVCPSAIRILDTEDLHGLREARRLSLQYLTHDRLWNQEFMVSESCLSNPISLRELASMYRVHLNLMVSRVEMDLARKYYRLDSDSLYFLPLLSNNWVETNHDSGSVVSRNHFMFIGNYKHAPNRDAVHHLCRDLWPSIREKIPNQELHLYGAYADADIQKLNNVSLGIYVKGRADDVTNVMKGYLLQLAPLRFGAGIKGKILEAILSELPTITTPIGREGLDEYLYDHEFPGEVTCSDAEFIEKTIFLAQNKRHYEQKITESQKIKDKLMSDSISFTHERMLLNNLLNPMFLERLMNTSMVHQSFRQNNSLAHRYLSKYIAEKNKNA